MLPYLERNYFVASHVSTGLCKEYFVIIIALRNRYLTFYTAGNALTAAVNANKEVISSVKNTTIKIYIKEI